MTWASSDSTVVLITSAGVATGEQAGPATITATAIQNGMKIISNTANVVVTPSPLTSITVTPATASIPEAVSTQFNALFNFANGSQQTLTSSAAWASSQPSVGTISNTYTRQGLATGVGPGTTNITAVFGSVVSNAATLTVTTATLTSIAVTAPTLSVTAGTPVQFTAKGTFSDASVIDLSTQVTWTSISTVPNVTVATINSTGLANTVAPGTTTITATFTQNGVTVSGSATLTVN